MPSKSKVVLAYSGGLDTSVILKWLKEELGHEVITFTADIGQGEEDTPAIEQKAKKTGATQVYIENLIEELTCDYIFPMFRGNALYEESYLLGTSIARPLIAKRQVEIAQEVGAQFVSHGATGKGNDQIRFELGYYANMPEVKVIAPWRVWALNSRKKLLEFAKRHEIEVSQNKEGAPPYSMDANILHLSIEGNSLEDTTTPAEEDTYIRVKPIEQTPNTPEQIRIDFHKGDPISINGQQMSPATLLGKLNELGGKHGIGRIDIVENRFIGMKSRGVYETPGGTILLFARKALESITLDKGAMHLKQQIMPQYAQVIYNGFWFSPERRMLQALIDESQNFVTGHVILKLFKGNCIIESRYSPFSLFDKNIVTFEEDEGFYTQSDAEGFIRLNALRLKADGARLKGIKNNK